jgi:hypothetical protein
MNEVAAQQELSPPVVPDIPGARPLRIPAHERYARARSLLVPKVEAYRDAYRDEDRSDAERDYHADRGNASKLERKQKVLDRIKFLTRQPEEVLRAKRERIESFLWAAHETNYADFWKSVDVPEYVAVYDDDGEPTGETAPTGRMVKRQTLRMFDELTEEQQRMIASLKYTEKGRPILETYSRMQANIELRKLLGLGNAEREESDEFGRMNDVELFAEIMREAKELGIDAELTFKAHGANA